MAKVLGAATKRSKPGVFRRAATASERNRIVCVVSEGEEFRAYKGFLTRKRHRVIEPNTAAHALAHHKDRHLVVCHGTDEGDRLVMRLSGKEIDWLHIGMPTPPKGGALYLYACNSGRQLLSFLEKHGCTAYGHIDVVPAPTEDPREPVNRFLAYVMSIISEDALPSSKRMAERLRTFVVTELVSAYKADSLKAIRNEWEVRVLSRSLP